MHKTNLLALFILTQTLIGGMILPKIAEVWHMYVNSGYLNNSRVDFKDTTMPLVVGSCGTYRLIKKPLLPTQRPKGRVDYQLLYVASGKAHFFFDSKDTIVNAGSMVLYRPHEPQKYIYHAKDHPEVYWVHFTGYDVHNILKFYGFPDDMKIMKTGTSPEFKRLYIQMIQELQLCRPHYEEALASTLNHLFILISRSLQEVRSLNIAVHNDIVQAVYYFNENYSQNISIEQYADEHHFSTTWFTRGFKEYTGMTPMQYILSLRMTNAQHLLEHSTNNVTEVANIVGYDNPLYFSRLFKKHFGQSPVQYRKSLEQAK